MNRKRVGILVFPQVEVLDFCGPFEVFSVTRVNETYAAAGTQALTVTNVAPTLTLAGPNSVQVGVPYSLTLSRVQRFLYDVCNPYLRLFRRVLPPLGPLDLSPVLAVVVLFALQRGLDAIFARLH